MKRLGMYLFILFFLEAGCTGNPVVPSNKATGSEFYRTSLGETIPLIHPRVNLPRENAPISLAVSPSGEWIALPDKGEVALWDAEGQKEARRFQFGNKDFLSVTFSFDGRTLAAGTYQTLVVWNIATGKSVSFFSGHPDYVTALAFSPDNQILASGSSSEKGVVYLWNIPMNKIERRLTYPTQYFEEVRHLAFSPDGRWLSSIGMDGYVRLWDIEGGNTTPVEEVGLPKKSPFTSAFSPDSQVLVFGTGEGDLVFYDLGKREIFKSLRGHRGRVESVSFSREASFLISVGQDKVIRRWEPQTGEPIGANRLPFETPFSILSVDGTQLGTLGPLGVSVFDLKRDDLGLPPFIALFTPSEHWVVQEPFIRLTGRVFDDLGVSDVSVQINGNPVELGSGLQVRDMNIERKNNLREVFLNEKISLRPGTNIISVTATDLEGKGRTETLRVTYKPDAGRVWAAVIGISRYANVEGLRYADRDAMAFYDYLVKDNSIPEEQVTLLVNETATLQSIRDLLGVTLKKKVQKFDTVIIYYAGHGAAEADPGSLDSDGLEKYLVPHDGDPKRLFSTAIPMGEISRIFSRLSAERIVLIQDACYSGGSEIGGRAIPTGLYRSSISQNFLDRLAAGKGRVILTASMASEVSVEREDLNHGVFTYYLLESFHRGDRDQDGFISVNEAFHYVSNKVPEATGQNQHPVKKGEEVREIVLGRARASIH